MFNVSINHEVFSSHIRELRNDYLANIFKGKKKCIHFHKSKKSVYKVNMILFIVVPTSDPRQI